MSQGNESWIYLKGLRAEGARVGVYAYEKRNPWPVFVDVGLLTTIAPAAHSEQLRDTIDYDEVAQLITELCRSRHFDLLETLAEVLATQLLEAFGPKKITIEVHKQGILGGATASVRVERTP